MHKIFVAVRKSYVTDVWPATKPIATPSCWFI